MAEQISKEKENSILEAARKRFAHYGFSKVTVEEIAADVDMGKASLYYYFPTKESLFQAVLAQEQKGFIKEMEEVINSSIPASEKLKECINKRTVYFHKFLNIGTLGLHAFMDNRSFYKKFFLDFEKKELELVNRIIDLGKKSGEFRNDLDKNLATLILHILHGLRIRTLRVIKGYNPDEETMKALQIETNLAAKVLINGILK